MQPDVAASASTRIVANERGQYGNAGGAPGAKRDLGVGGIFLLLGITVGIYALSPGARYWYKHGYLPPVRR
jgi:hypothetical protein